jgi:hypothetical protein
MHDGTNVDDGVDVDVNGLTILRRDVHRNVLWDDVKA